MGHVCLHDRAEIETFLKRDLYLHLYAIGDLDDFFWPYTTWYGSVSGGELRAIVLVYVGPTIPTVLGLSSDNDAMTELLSSIHHLLPQRFYAHLSTGLESVLGESHRLESHGEHRKMALLSAVQTPDIDTGVISLDERDLPSILELYEESYPRNWFDPRMLETGQYFGIKENGRVVSIAGVHVYSPTYRVAALGNIVTLPTHRNNGLATRVTGHLCRSLQHDGIRVGLNVKANNDAAIACYTRLGFRNVADYSEFTVYRRS